ncbi:MAG TPA: hypothetical protein VEO96_04520 [Thermoplasmata archaeon]|nr:hypothetical protein [Thermoplasmata archaeon]
MPRTALSRAVAALVLVGLASFVAGTYLAQYSIEQSWFTFTPPGETEPQTVFRPYLATLIPSVALLATGIFGVAAALVDPLEAGDERRRVFFLTYGSVSLAVGIALVFHGFNYSFFLQCADPGGCQEVFLPFWPAFIPGIVMVVTGLFSVVFRIRGIPELPQSLTRSA